MARHNTPDTKGDEIKQRRKDVWRLRIRGKSIPWLADYFDVSVGTIHGDLEAVRQMVTDDAKGYCARQREIELARIDAWIDTATTQLEAIPDLKDYIDGWDFKEKGLPPKIEQLAPILTALKGLSERRAKLLGLDAPVKSELTGAEGGPVQIDAKDALIHKLAGLATGAAPEAEASEPDSEPDA